MADAQPVECREGAEELPHEVAHLVGGRVRVRVGVRARVRVGVGVRVEGRGAVLVLARLLAIERLAELDDRRPRALLGLRLGSGLG